MLTRQVTVETNPGKIVLFEYALSIGRRPMPRCPCCSMPVSAEGDLASAKCSDG